MTKKPSHRVTCATLISALVLWSTCLLADNSSIKGLFEGIENVVETGNVDAINTLVYPLGSGIGSNREWILGGIQNPTEARSDDNGFNMAALKKIIAHTDRFEPVNQSRHFDEIQRGFRKMFEDNNPGQPFLKDLEKGGKNILTLEEPKTRSMILIYHRQNHYQLVWWKEMIRVADQF